MEPATCLGGSREYRLFVHCANHFLDLVLQEVAKEVRLVADTLNFVREVTVTINKSAKRKNLYQSLFGCGEVVNLLSLCPTRWCVRVAALSRLLTCYGEMLQTFQTLENDRTVRGETRAKVAGLVKKATTTRTVFGLFACVALFSPCESVAWSLQGTKVTALGSMEAATLLCQRLSTLRQEATFVDLVGKMKQYEDHYNLATTASAHQQDPNYPSLWKREMFEALDLVRSEVERRFDQEGLRVAAGREQAILEAAQGKQVNVGSPDLTPFSREKLCLELDILSDVCRGREVLTIEVFASILRTLQPQTHSMLSEVEKLLKLCQALPISVAASERTWLRNTMKQERLTHLAIMNAHSDLLDECDVSSLLEQFISRSTERRSTFGKI